MAKENETITDIIAEKRRRADEIERDCAEKMRRGEMVSDCYARELVADIRREADRLEAAHKREVREAKDLFRKPLKKQEDTLRDQYEALVGFSNRAKLREALEDIGRLVEQIHFLYPDYPSEIHEIARKVNAALAAPPRNCDVYNNESCRMAYHLHGDGLMTMQAFADWLFAPATEKKGGAK